MNTPSNAGKEHDVKCWLEFYEAVEAGEKPFEIRLNDRDYQVGDTLLIREYNPYGQNYTGRSCRRLVTYMTDWEQKPGHVVLGLQTTPPTQSQVGAETELSKWLLGKIEEAEKSVRAREQAAETWRSGTDASWAEASEMHPSTAGKPIPKAERLKAANRESRIAEIYRREVEMFKAAYAAQRENDRLRSEVAGLHSLIDAQPHHISCRFIYPKYLTSAEKCSGLYNYDCWKSKARAATEEGKQ